MDWLSLQGDNRVAGRDARRGRGALGIHVANADAFLLGRPQGQDAEKPVLEGFGSFAASSSSRSMRCSPRSTVDVHLVAGVAAADLLLHLGSADDLAAVDLDDPVAGLQARRGGGAFRRQAAIIGSPV